jgi:hypothetical protein
MLFFFLVTEMFLTLFKSIVRPYLEYGSNVWFVIYKKEAIQIENVHRRATKLVKKYTTSELHRTHEISWIAITSIQKTDEVGDTYLVSPLDPWFLPPVGG